jgi:ABC-2 type transport system permease protein
MNTQSSATPEYFDSRRTAPAVVSPTQPFYWSVRRELWENRSIYIAPLAVAAVTLFGFLIATIGRALSMTNLAHRRAVLEGHDGFAAGLIMATAFVVAIFYSLDALHGERRDRSILFWKSLPVSDLTTVLSKASIPIVVLPLLTFAIVVAMEWVMLLLSTLVLLASGMSVAKLWTESSLFQSSAMLLYHLLTVHVLWHAPLYAWLLLVSAWARRATFLWAALPWFAIVITEKIVFNTSHFFALLMYRLTGPEIYRLGDRSGDAMDPMATLALGRFLGTPGLWIGLVVAAIFLAAAVQLRRRQGPI